MNLKHTITFIIFTLSISVSIQAQQPWHKHWVTKTALGGCSIIAAAQIVRYLKNAYEYNNLQYQIQQLKPGTSYYCTANDKMRRAIAYKASKNGNTSYLIGSYHYGYFEIFPPYIQKLYMLCDSITTEATPQYDKGLQNRMDSFVADNPLKPTYVLRNQSEEYETLAILSSIFYKTQPSNDDKEQTFYLQYLYGSATLLEKMIKTYPKAQNIINSANIDWIKKITAQHNNHKNNFIMVGALHLCGNQGLPTLLRNQGFTVERMGMSLFDKINVIVTRWFTSWWKK